MANFVKKKVLKKQDQALKLRKFKTFTSSRNN